MGSADRAVVGLVAAAVRPGVLVVGAGVAVIFYLGLTGSSADDLVDVSQIRVIAENPAVRALYGRTIEVASPGSFIVWRYGQLVTLFAAIWAMLTTTRVLRGEEELGRWDLLLAAPIRRRRLLLLVLGVLTLAMGVVAAALLGAFLLAGASLRGSLLFVSGFGLVLVVFVGVSALSSQVFAQRRRASGLAGAAIGGAFLVRMLADGATGMGSLRWLTPFGWLEEVEPFGGGRVPPLALLAMVAAGLVLLAVAAAERRDLGDGLVADVDRAEARTTLLRSPLGFAWRSRLGGLLGWATAVATLGLAVGGITSAFADFLVTHIGFQQIAADYGFAALVSAEGFVGTMAELTGVVLAAYGIVSVRSVWEDEATGRLELVFATPLTRTRWLLAAVAASGGAVLLVTGVAIVATYAGIAAGGADVTLGATATGVANTLPVVALFFGLAVLLHGVRPEQATVVCGGAAAASYLVSFIGPALDWPAWVRWLSPFDHLAVVPAAAVDWTSAAVLGGLAVGATVAGFVGYARRDLR